LNEATALALLDVVRWRCPVFERLKLLEWTFSATAEAVIGALLALVLVLSVFA
jgi:hypothetical protein